MPTLQTLKNNKGKAAGVVALVPLLYTLLDCYQTAQHNKAAIHRTEVNYVDVEMFNRKMILLDEKLAALERQTNHP